MLFPFPLFEERYQEHNPGWLLFYQRCQAAHTHRTGSFRFPACSESTQIRVRAGGLHGRRPFRRDFNRRLALIERALPDNGDATIGEAGYGRWRAPPSSPLPNPTLNPPMNGRQSLAALRAVACLAAGNLG